MVTWTSEFINEFTLITILTLFQIIGLYFAIKVKLILGKARFWDLIIIGLGLMLFRRVLVFFNLLGFSCCKNSIFLYNLDTIYLPLITWLLLAMAFFELYLKVKNGKTLSSKKKSTKRKTVKKVGARKQIQKQTKAKAPQTQPSRVKRFFTRKTEDGYIDMTGN